MSADRRVSALLLTAGTTTGDSTTWARRFALLAGVALLGSFLRVLYHVTDVVGGTTRLAAVVVVALAAGTVAARTLRLGVALAVGACLLAAGLWAYLSAVPSVYVAVLTEEFAADLVELVFGELRILGILRADLWAVTVAPAPVFGTWYLLVRRHYDLAAWVGGLTLGFFVLTGDAGDLVALLGATSVLAVLGFGTLEESEATWDDIQNVGLLLACVVVATRLARPVTAGVLPSTRSSAVPGGPNSPGSATVEGSLLDAPARVDVLGSISLSPNVRFAVTADEPALWRAGAYDRFTGGGWVRTGEDTDYAGALSSPPGETERIEQTFEALSVVNVMPAAWKPVEVDPDVAQRTRVTALEGLRPTSGFSNGASYSVTSERPAWTEERLEAAEGDDPPAVRERYLQLPTSTPERVGRFAGELTAAAEIRFEKAARIERWLEANKEYSLEVTRPEGNVADAFLFEMDAGYCTYYATTMTAMLRTLDVPARFAVGYTTGQRSDDGEWLVRGFNAHAWVEVFFPTVGWVTFDPTPGGAREAARRQRLREDRNSDSAANARDQIPAQTSSPAEGDADETSRTNGSANDTPTATPAAEGRLDEQRGAVTPNPESTPSLGDVDSSMEDRAGTDASGGPTGVSRRSLFAGLSRSDQVTLVAGLVGLTLGVSRFELLKRGGRLLELHWQPASDSPRRDVERAFDRLERVLARRHRPRRDGETRRAYVEAIRAAGRSDERLECVLEIYERAVFRGDVSRERADEARETVTQVVREESFIGGGSDGRLR